MNISIERKRTDCSALPKGWQREEVLRKTGLSAGKVDVFYYSPTGKKFRSKPELVRYLGDSMDLSCFDFQQGQINTMLLCKTKKARAQFDYRGVRSDSSLVPPIRQTASIFKQPVTVYKTQESKVKTDLKQGTQEKPKQLFWEKRLENLTACDANGVIGTTTLPKYIKPLGPFTSDATTIQSLATALHVSSQPITGQTGSKQTIMENPGVFLNPEQPLIAAVTITKDDVRRQEERNLTACDANGVIGTTTLPKYIKPLGPFTSDATTIQSLATALHVSSQPITGQTGSKQTIMENPGVFLNPEQPLIAAVTITKDDVRRQEERVNRARQRLRAALAAA
ncbi:Methyl-CpG-binding domain protein 3 [Papilio machaon]|uniref:Methyl-CpG-binding domain protein 3 n=1 Tax=Papilio machaon TaxID=76193 RepID=A0A194RD56_PAPMA|nr:Methyl-CpG-binding domain protein 3 [Papilio machaon]